jgi:hypothetical protein
MRNATAVTSRMFPDTVHLSGLIGKVSHPDMQKIRIIRFFLEQAALTVLLSSTVIIYNIYLRLNPSTMPDLKF